MPGQRAEGQKQIITMMKEEFVSEIEASLSKMGYADRSAFIREAVYEKMDRMGIKVPKEYHVAPVRTGAGGAKKYKKTKPHPRKKKI